MRDDRRSERHQPIHISVDFGRRIHDKQRIRAQARRGASLCVDVAAAALAIRQTLGDNREPTRHAVPRALAELSAAQREGIFLRFADDLTLEQIAELVDVPVGTAKSRLHHALRTLRSLLK